MKKIYEQPLLRLAFYENCDVLTNSGETDDTDGFNEAWLD